MKSYVVGNQVIKLWTKADVPEIDGYPEFKGRGLITRATAAATAARLKFIDDTISGALLRGIHLNKLTVINDGLVTKVVAFRGMQAEKILGTHIIKIGR